MPARQAALRMLDSVLRTGATLDSSAGHAKSLAPADRALALAIAGETLRRLPDLDELIDSSTRQRLPDDSKARMVLRLALAQKIGLGTPDHALVSTALPLVDGGPRRLVHGVLGTLLRRGLPAMAAPRLPADVEARWAEAWGEDAVMAARAQIAARPPLDLSFTSDEAARAFAAPSLASSQVRLSSQAVEQLPGFDSGDFWVQDLAASLPARLVPTGARTVLDLCAAPGGKTMQLAAAGHDVTALDVSGRRLDRLRANLARTGLDARIVTADLLEWVPDGTYDAVLLDAPCSATGTFRRHPEVLHRARPSVIAEMAVLQRRMIERAAAWVKPGGTLVYAVCSFERDEGEQVVADFLAAHPGFAIAPPEFSDLPEFIPVSQEGWVRILPGLLAEEGGLDGFFIARLVAAG
ncbi:MAG: RsmB/NOP family class I SAM-dependent RNA methyltransferase [Sphingomicrobium sp.]